MNTRQLQELVDERRSDYLAKAAQDGVEAIPSAQPADAECPVCKWPVEVHDNGEACKAAPPPVQPQAQGRRHWRDVFGTGVHTREQVQEVYRRLASAYHPGRGGDPAKMAELNGARDEALQEVGHA